MRNESRHTDASETLRNKPVLIICDDEDCGDTVARIVRKRGFDVVCCLRMSDARPLLLDQTFGAVFCEDTLPDGDFRSAIRSSGAAPVVVISRTHGQDRRLGAVESGAFSFTACPPDSEEVARILWNAASAP